MIISKKVLRAALTREGWRKFYGTKHIEIWTSPSEKMHLSVMGKSTLCISEPGRAEEVNLADLDFATFRLILSEGWRKSKKKRVG